MCCFHYDLAGKEENNSQYAAKWSVKKGRGTTSPNSTCEKSLLLTTVCNNYSVHLIVHTYLYWPNPLVYTDIKIGVEPTVTQNCGPLLQPLTNSLYLKALQNWPYYLSCKGPNIKYYELTRLILCSLLVAFI